MVPKILYEDNHLIAVFKPAGFLTQGDKSGETSLFDEVKKYLKEKYKKPGNVFLGLLHRLDRPVSGIVLFAKTSKGASRISEQFRNHEVKKIYYALVSGKPKEARGELVNYLKKDELTRKTSVSDEEGAKATLLYELVVSNDKYSLLRITLGTGKFHQIRAQLSAVGFPILGDTKYGSSTSLPGREIALVSCQLSFKLATKDEEKTISVPLPEEWRKYIKFDDSEIEK
ncbi:MAG: RNA pseudouridine synthase [Candidatus Pacebacteria bacterium]|nr:RNA pseudouridine synthase [Candidatus Paceibacterota bacterium]